MITAPDFVKILKEHGIEAYTGVPCSFFQAAINCVLDDPSLRYIMMPNEGSALALAAGSHMAGISTAVLIQNSGFGNLVNPLTSLVMIYKTPVLIFMSGRAYGVSDEPQHEIMGRTMTPVLKAMGVNFSEMPDEPETFDDAMEKAMDSMEATHMPYVFLVKKGTIDTYASSKTKPTSYPLKRLDAIKLVTEALKGDESVIATTGMPSRELFSLKDSDKHFYMQGSMGHAAAIGLGIALAQPKKKVVVLDGDGALLMHMGILSSVGFYKPKNFHHIVLDNEAYETTGNQDTTSPNTDFKTIARASGYADSREAATAADVKLALTTLLVQQGPTFLRIKINRQPAANVPRISSKHTSEQIARNFSATLNQ